jgi:phospholipid transport system transporter-binding protein
MSSMLKLPAVARMDDAPAVWASLQAGLRAEAAQVKSAAGGVVTLSAAELRDFDSSALSLLLSAKRWGSEEGVNLQISDAPEQLLELARLYGVVELIWPVG